MAGDVSISNWLRGILGAVVGAALGYSVFFFLAGQGLYAIVIPGALLGLGCGYLSGLPSLGLGILCGLSAILLGLFIEWQFAPFIKDDRLSYFMTHLHDLRPATLIMIALGGLFGFWFGKGRERTQQPPASES